MPTNSNAPGRNRGALRIIASAGSGATYSDFPPSKRAINAPARTVGARHPIVRPRQLRISCQRLVWDIYWWTLTLHDGVGGRKRWGFNSRHECMQAAVLIGRTLNVPIRGKFSLVPEQRRRAAQRAAKRTGGR
jgi:hypothetical protein